MRTMADLPVQHPQAPGSAAAARARFFNSGNAFNITLPPVPAALFPAPEGGATALHPCDQGAAFGCPFPATTPLMLARHATIRAGESLRLDFAATGTVGCVLRGAGSAGAFAWAEGDVFLLPGGVPATLTASADALLWLVSNDPLLAFEGLAPTRPHGEAIHFPAAEIERQLALIGGLPAAPGQSGLAVIFSAEALEAWRNLTPTLTLSLNTLPTGASQPAHRHNSAAITVPLQGEDCWSTVDGVRHDWRRGATLVTPPGAAHSHHNGGATQARFLIVQDGGLHYHARTMDFRLLDGG